MDGLDFVGNVRLDTEIKNTNSVIVTPPSGVPMMLTYDQDIKLAGPAAGHYPMRSHPSWANQSAIKDNVEGRQFLQQFRPSLSSC